MSNSTASAPELKLLSVVIPVRDEEGCIASTVEHLHVELRLQHVPHEIVVVDDDSADATCTMLESFKARVPNLRPMQNPTPHGFGRAVACGLDHMNGDAVVVMMADESDDCRDVIRYKLNESYDCVFGNRFIRGGGVIDYPKIKGLNIKYLPGSYWDFWDHYLSLTEQSLREVLEVTGFEVELCIWKFVPYQMVRRGPVPLLLVRLYLKLPWTWHFFGQQFLVIARA